MVFWNLLTSAIDSSATYSVNIATTETILHRFKPNSARDKVGLLTVDCAPVVLCTGTTVTHVTCHICQRRGNQV